MGQILLTLVSKNLISFWDPVNAQLFDTFSAIKPMLRTWRLLSELDYS